MKARLLYAILLATSVHTVIWGHEVGSMTFEFLGSTGIVVAVMGMGEEH